MHRLWKEIMTPEQITQTQIDKYRHLTGDQPIHASNLAPLAPVLRGEGLGVRGLGVRGLGEESQSSTFISSRLQKVKRLFG